MVRTLGRGEDGMTTWICEACGGPVVVWGALGRLLWGRCRACGADSCQKQRCSKSRRTSGTHARRTREEIVDHA